MLEMLFWFGLAGLFAGVMVGRMRLTGLMVQAATAGAAALVVFALQALGPVEAWRFGANPASAELVTLLYLEVVSLAVLGWGLSRLRIESGE